MDFSRFRFETPRLASLLEISPRCKSSKFVSLLSFLFFFRLALCSPLELEKGALRLRDMSVRKLFVLAWSWGWGGQESEGGALLSLVLGGGTSASLSLEKGCFSPAGRFGRPSFQSQPCRFGAWAENSASALMTLQSEIGKGLGEGGDVWLANGMG